MRSRWEALRSGLLRSIQRREAIDAFDAIRRREIAEFVEPTSLAGYLAHPAGDLDHKDRVLRCLVESPSEIAISVLLLGLWPGIDAIFNRRLTLFRQQPQDLGAEIVLGLTIEARRLDLTRVNRIAATLVRNTERRLVDRRRRELAIVTEPLSSGVVDLSSVDPAAPNGSIATLHQWLRGIVADEADIVVAAVLLGRTSAELAASLGVSAAAVRKRLQRALLRARRALERKNGSHTSQPNPRLTRDDHQTR
jgi:DNA-directed RNA polymerase specialized sigma24 family protein